MERQRENSERKREDAAALATLGPRLVFAEELDRSDHLTFVTVQAGVTSIRLRVRNAARAHVE